MKKIIKIFVSTVVILFLVTGCGFMEAYYSSNYENSSNSSNSTNSDDNESTDCISYRIYSNYKSIEGNSVVIFTNNCKQDKLVHFNYESRGGNWLSTSIFILAEGGKRTVKIGTKCIVRNVRSEDS
ncbi:MAG: hypothetical protein HN704_11935 [Bacteroidetes bacterium]|jgi:hypothetical protein|nr:hypothetical protein [Bacteroidota bacterium]MBT7142125.1 hypothetical protein [Bacteroidota bacterium]MBT7492301.1 hypothetical protein [Bacteroidota bacterium]